MHIDDLHCPYCRGPLAEIDGPARATELGEFGLVGCDCACHPVIASVLILRPVAPAVIDDVAQGRNGAALARVLGRAERPRQTPALADTSAQTFEQAVRACRDDLYASYLIQRFGNPGFLAGIAALSQLCARPPATLLDLACGTGHGTHMASVLFPRARIWALDSDFANLVLAKRWLAPGATAICASAEAPLPLAGGLLDAVFCLDALHYVAGKAGLSDEFRRLLKPDGALLLPHLLNRDVEGTAHGRPLSVAGYARVFGFAEPAIRAEPEALATFLEVESRTPPPPAPEAAETLWLVGGGARRAGMGVSAYGQRLLERGLPLAANPIYRQTRQGGTVHLERVWPNERFEAECHGLAALTPSTARIEGDLLARAAVGRLGEADRSVALDLIKAFVLVPLPPRYLQPDRPEP